MTPYSLLSATLMGSSLGLVIYQRRTISLLHNDTTTINSSLYPASIESSTATVPTTTTTTFRFSVFLLSCWFPVAVWFVTLMSTSFLVGLENFIPRCFSPRTGILVSHLVFAVVWVILASVQEVYESLSSSSHQQQPQAGVWPSDSSDSVQTNNNVMRVEHHPSVSSLQQPQLYQKYPSMQQRQQAQQGQALRDSNLTASLCVIWYVAVILLGVATALLATSSTVLDSMMDQQLQELLDQEDEDVVGGCEEKELGFRDTVSITVDTSAQRMQYPLAQKLTLALMILVLFYSQMWFFEWIHSALSSLSSSGLAVSTRLGLFGLFSSSIMVTLGARLLPVTTTSTIGSR
ncbi:hypothetical protein KI688_010837 [Linnemannia hyalina]|uniref:Transmembrane protein n=1 Tax=Linnemannia hyalina TaxID=64524 RepID=A0A9P8BX58_9FUNG|nr:hypothetical protein KI688_010837 [Linnemannia hyalina]